MYLVTNHEGNYKAKRLWEATFFLSSTTQFDEHDIRSAYFAEGAFCQDGCILEKQDGRKLKDLRYIYN